MIVTIFAKDAADVDAAQIRAVIETLGYYVSTVAVTDDTDGFENLERLPIPW